MPCLGRARAQPQPTPGRLLRDLPEPVSSAQPGSRLGSPGAWVALAVVEPLSAPADSRRVGVSTSGGRTAPEPSAALPLGAAGHARLDGSRHRLSRRAEYAGPS